MPQQITEFADIQGIIRSGYGTLDEAVFLLLRVVDATKAKSWIGAVAGQSARSVTSLHVTSVEDLRTMQPIAMQIAFTATGLRRLGLADDLLSGFSREFCGGMGTTEAQAEGRSRRLGDLGANAPSKWQWGADDPPDAVLLLYAKTGGLESFAAQVKSDIAGAFTIAHEFPTTIKKVGENDRLEHFGFMDGVSQPVVDWKAERDPGAGDEMQYRNLISPGEFLLGYANEYGLYEDRPLLDRERDPKSILAEAADEPGKRDLARNGSYLVFRQLDQDVAGFWRFVADQQPLDNGLALAEAMVGRRLETADPLVGAATSVFPGVGPAAVDLRRNGFTFYDDPDGIGCPFGAHIRRANPRTTDIPGGKQGLVSYILRMLGFVHGGPRKDVVSSSRFHRILRRGRSYGPFVDHEAVLRAGSVSQSAGLHFIGLNASISRQFEFIQNAWLANPTFDGMRGEADPLLGNRLDFPAGHPTDAFTIPKAGGPCRRVSGLPQFVTVRGGAYFFLPSLRALRFLAQ